LCGVFTRDLCVYLMECQGARYRDAAHCERELDCFGLPQLTAAADSGAVEYDPSKVGACHARFLESPCTFGFFLFTPDIYEVLSYCPGTITPKLQAGEACSSNGECSTGLYCYKGVDYQCPGTCRLPATEGQDCAGSGRCADGLECEADVCVAEPKAGDPCDASCDYSVSCAEGEICQGNIWCDRELGQCQLGRLPGEPCGASGTEPLVSDAQCAIHSWCDAVGTGAGVCRQPSAQGGPCNDGFSACEDGLHCVGYLSAAGPERQRLRGQRRLPERPRMRSGEMRRAGCRRRSLQWQRHVRGRAGVRERQVCERALSRRRVRRRALHLRSLRRRHLRASRQGRRPLLARHRLRHRALRRRRLLRLLGVQRARRPLTSFDQSP
jgi:hypothetical protein